ncbi:glycosyltransferase family 8 protein [Methanobrevibacter curvatus]|uniref:General stress protein A n=1 Tax=Methanobrevibacter curvatus TaxID=49547 RepID=A0A166ALK0_9EURY|nr:glycosyltransferase family 8 protein [Methanobrevibacter curvatus]KZX12196.1 general stress protein A [Methanobrevibacter curvatus]
MVSYIIKKEKLNPKAIYRMLKAYKEIKKDDFFDEEFYLKKYPHIKDSKLSPLDHFIYHGYKEGKIPSKNFDPKFYLKKYPDVKKSQINPLIHYTLYGKREKRQTTANNLLNIALKRKEKIQKLETQYKQKVGDLENIIDIEFDKNYYLNKYEDLKKAKIRPIEHYIRYGKNENRYPNKKIENLQFNRKYYLNKYPDVKKAKMDPYLHYLKFGKNEGRHPNQKIENIRFDRKYYLNKYPDIKKAKIDPVEHYLTYGEKENRYPNKKLKNIQFDRKYYINKYPDIKKAKIDPTEHYIRYGEKEGRYPNKKIENIRFDKNYYLNKYPDIKKAKIDPIEHYLTYGEKEGRHSNQKIENIKFDKKYYLDKYPDIKKAKIDPTEHYLTYGEKENRYPNKKLENIQFNRKYYLNKYLSLKEDKIDPIEHYIKYGEKKGNYSNKKLENIQFDKNYYLNKYPDIKKAKIDPVEHYLTHGEKEGRHPNQKIERIKFDKKYYLDKYPDIKKAKVDPVEHYLTHGEEEGRHPNKNAEYNSLNGLLNREKQTNQTINILKEEINKEKKQSKHDLEKLKNEFKEYNISLNSIQIKKDKISTKLENFKEYGINKEKRIPQLIISLTSSPETIYNSHYTLYSLLSQETKPDEIILWLSKEEFPNLENDIPHKLKNLKKNGLTIKWCEDIGDYKKLIPSLKEYPNSIIVTANDDILYPKDWLDKLYNEYDGKNIIAHSTKRISSNADGDITPYNEWKPTTANEESILNYFDEECGVLYPPNSLYVYILNSLSIKSSPNNNIFAYTMALKNNTKIKPVPEGYNKPEYTDILKGIDNNSFTLLGNKSAKQNPTQYLKKHHPATIEKLKNYLTVEISIIISSLPESQQQYIKSENIKSWEKQRISVNKINEFKNKFRQYTTFINRSFNKTKIDHEIENFRECGITKVKRDPKIIVSLASFPERMYDMHYTLYSLLSQNTKPDKIILWLSKEEFPNLENDIPIKVKNFKKYGLTIKWCKNLKSYNKLIFTLKEYPEDIIVTADDDVLYPKNWLGELYKIYDGNSIICHRAHSIMFENDKILPYVKWKKTIQNESSSFLNFFTGVGGVLYPPNSLFKDVLNEKLFMNLAPSTDDIWFWAMAVMNDKKIKIVDNGYRELIYVNIKRELGLNNETTLNSQNVGGLSKNNISIDNIVNHYPQILLKLNESNRVPIVFITDENYVIPTSVSIVSLITNKNKSTFYDIFIIADNLTLKHKEKLISMQNSDVRINIIDFSSEKFEKMHVFKEKALCVATKAALLKFEIPNIFPSEDKILYLDGDIIVKKDLKELFSKNIEKYYVAAVHDTGKLYSNRQHLEIPTYFNSGMMLLNLEYLRKDNISNLLIKTKKELKDMNLMDQNVFNIVLHDEKVKLIDIKFNFLLINLHRAKKKYKFEQINSLFRTSYQNLEDIEKKAVIIHFASADKPWKYTDGLYSKEWYSYFKNSPFKNELEKIQDFN